MASLTLGPTLVWLGAGLGLGTASLATFLFIHGPGRRHRAAAVSVVPRAPTVPAPAPLTGEFSALSDRPDGELDAALRLWAGLAASSGCRVVVEASADASGSGSANRKVIAGRARAAVVRLHEAGIPDQRIRVVHLSPQPGPNEATRQRLRFVHLRVED